MSFFSSWAYILRQSSTFSGFFKKVLGREILVSIKKNRRPCGLLFCVTRDGTRRCAIPPSLKTPFPQCFAGAAVARSESLTLLHKKQETQGLLLSLPETGLGPVRAQCPGDFKSPVSTIPPLWRKGDDMTKISLRLLSHPL